MRRHYGDGEYPALDDQQRRWQRTQPLAGLRVLDATPIFFNTVAKYLVTSSGGAEVVIAQHPRIPSDPEVCALLREHGYSVISAEEALAQQWDLVFDCAGRFREAQSLFGYAELTRSGAHAYQHVNSPVVLVDESPLKLVETVFGTGDGLVRALTQADVPIRDRNVLVFGGGKVGSGIALNVTRAGAAAQIVDVPTCANYTNAPVVDLADHDAVNTAIGWADIIVTATGVVHATEPFSAALNASPAVLANMGIDDEFGPGVDSERVLGGKSPIDFSLSEPTLMRYMDPVFAVSNEALVQLRQGGVGHGIHPPDSKSEALIAAAMRAAGANRSELDMIVEITGRTDLL